MPLRKIREDRRRLGVGVRKGPRTLTLIFLLIIVIILISALARVG
ncbi:MAG: hypothetical protein OEM23_07495 [Gemmatimonadota bacterium]|nr:hypothetical protein [Gemmatimonadota bacterium]MDH3428262.1 hypothetical protein [Gemmatimonadota bacterium]